MKIIAIIFLIAIMAYIFTSVASFLQISFESYINYLLFMCAIAAFYVILPKQVGDAFM